MSLVMTSMPVLWIVLTILAQTVLRAQAPPGQTAEPNQTAPPGASAADEDYHVYTDSPRLLMSKRRIRLLQRERERQSMRWQQFDSLISGGAVMPEPGFAWALHYQAAGDAASGRKAIQWALGSGADAEKDLRQLALVFDWCARLMNPEQTDQLAAKLTRGLNGPALADNDIRGRAARVLAAVALADRLSDHGEAFLRGVVQDWWRGKIVKQLASGLPAIPREQMYALYEVLFAIRDNLRIDLRESAWSYFKTLPIDELEGHYPGPFQAPENEYRIPIYIRDGEPGLAEAAMSRAAGLAMVDFDTNALENQYLQGWLMVDQFQLRGALGSVYEFLWANPYQPGLSYSRLPLVFHDPGTGHVFARTSWDDDATWLGYFDGRLQLFRDGRIQTLRSGAAVKPVHVGDAVLLSAADSNATRFRADAGSVFVLNLAPHARYNVEIDDREMMEMETDAGGTLLLSLPDGIHAGVRVQRQRD
jgi:hypothetical protein